MLLAALLQVLGTVVALTGVFLLLGLGPTVLAGGGALFGAGLYIEHAR